MRICYNSNMKTIPTVGIILTTYNKGVYILEAIESLKKQTFQDFEIHIVDDGSNDGVTHGIIRKLKYDKITEVFAHVDNRGVAIRQKEQYKIMNNKYLLILCGDDVLASTFLEKTVGFLEKHKDYGAISVNVKLFDKTPEDAFLVSEYSEEKITLPHLLARNHVLGSSLMRGKAIKEADLSGGFMRYQDWDRWISMMEKGWKIGLIKEPLFYYRQEPKSLSHKAKKEDEMEMRRKLLIKHKESYRRFYDEIIMDMEHAFLEIKEGKDWLDTQYYRHIKEIKNLNQKIEGLNQQIEKLSRVIEAKNGVIDELRKDLERQDSLRFLLKKRIQKVIKKT